jgi:hypothetical protein
LFNRFKRLENLTPDPSPEGRGEKKEFYSAPTVETVG